MEKLTTKQELSFLVNNGPDRYAFNLEGNDYLAEWNSVRKDKPKGCVDIKLVSGLASIRFSQHEMSTGEVVTTPMFNWKDGTEEDKILEVFLERSNIFQGVKHLKETRDIMRKALIDLK